MLDWFSCIPAWPIAFSGACIVLLSLATSSTWLRHIESKIIGMRDKREELKNQYDSCVEELKRSDTHHLHAALFVGQLGLIQKVMSERQSTVAVSDYGFFLSRIRDGQLQDVLCAMTAAGLEHHTELPVDLQDLSDRIIEGDLEASNELYRRRNSLVGQAGEYSYQLQDQGKILANRVARLQARERFVRSVSVTLNLFGLILVMMTHLPIWKVS